MLAYVLFYQWSWSKVTISFLAFTYTEIIMPDLASADVCFFLLRYIRHVEPAVWRQGVNAPMCFLRLAVFFMLREWRFSTFSLTSSVMHPVSFSLHWNHDVLRATVIGPFRFSVANQAGPPRLVAIIVVFCVTNCSSSCIRLLWKW